MLSLSSLGSTGGFSMSNTLTCLSKNLFGIEWALNGTNLTDEVYQKPFGYNQIGRKFGISLKSKY